MGLKNLLGKKPAPQTLYFALEISIDLVKAAVWTVENGRVAIVNIGEVINIVDSDEQSILQAIDMALATANDELDQEPDSVVFGLPRHWVDDSSILPKHKQFLKFLCQQLQLKPLGYVVTLEALTTYLRQQQGTPPTSIFIQLSKSELKISLVEFGQVIQQTVVGRSDDITSDVVEGLKRFGQVKQFPSRMILYNGHNNYEDLKQELLNYEWEKYFPFMHTPKVESLSYITSISAVAMSGGKEVALSLGLNIKDTNQEAEKPHSNDQLKDELRIEESTIEETVESEDDKQNLADKELVEKETSNSVSSTALPPGFKIAEQQHDIEITTEKDSQIVREETIEQTTHTSPIINEVKMIEAENIEASNKDKVSSIKLPSKIFFIEFLKNIKLPKINLSKLKLSRKPEQVKTPKVDDLFSENDPSVVKHKKSKINLKSFRFKLIFILVLLLISAGGVAAAGFWAYGNIFKAEIKVYLKAQDLQKTITISAVDDLQAVDPISLKVPIKYQTTTLTGKAEIQTTGEKLIGENAKGRVTIYNKTSKTKTFKKNDILISDKKLRYILVSDITIASRSAETTTDGEKITFGKADVDIEAGSIGENYNIPQDSNFTVKGYDNGKFAARAISEIGGGKSTKILAVSEKDQQNALEILQQQLILQAKQQLISGDMQYHLLTQTPEYKIEEQNYDHKVGEEADKVSVDAKITYTLPEVSQEDLQSVLLASLQKDLPANFRFANQSINFTIKPEENSPDSEKSTKIKDKKTKSMQINVDTTVKIVAKFDINQVKQNIVGKKLSIAQDYFANLPNISKTEIQLFPKMPTSWQVLPPKTENIKLETVEEL